MARLLTDHLLSVLIFLPSAAAVALAFFPERAKGAVRGFTLAVTGVGFIGAGVILRENQSQHVHGLTTAASIWVSAILGVACGWANLAVAATGLVLTVIVLVVSKPLEEALERRIGRPGDGKDDQPGGGSS